MTDDTGFAPNPFFGILTLATCKPGIRLTKKVGDYIAGFTSERLCKDLPGNERFNKQFCKRFEKTTVKSKIGANT